MKSVYQTTERSLHTDLGCTGGVSGGLYLEWQYGPSHIVSYSKFCFLKQSNQKYSGPGFVLVFFMPSELHM